RATPVCGRVEVLVEPLQALQHPALLHRGQPLRRLDLGGQPAAGLAGVVEAALVDAALHVGQLGREPQRRGLVDVAGGAEDVLDVVEVARLGPQHPRDLHEAAQRDGPDAVLGALPGALQDGRREAQVEPQRTHAGRLGGAEVAELVDGDQQEQAEDGDEKAHAAVLTASWTAARARASASSSWPSDASGSAATSSRARSTRAAMSRKPIWPSRNDATAASLAAFSTHGAVPPSRPAARASARQRNVARSGGSKSSCRGAARSSDGTGVAARSG